MNAEQHRPQTTDYFLTRRQFLNRFGFGLGTLGLAGLLAPRLMASPTAAAPALSPLAPKPSHYPGRARHVIHIFAQGGPSHLDTWDPKPGIARYAGKNISEIGGVPLPSPFKFERKGESGLEVSELFPRLSECIDDLAVIRSMQTDIPAHEFATIMMNTGSGRLVKPSVGAWVTYGLGTENENLPGFIALAPGGNALGGSQNWRSAFLPGAYQGTAINTQNTSVDRLIENIRNQFTKASRQREQLDLLRGMNQLHSETLRREAVLEARIQSFELAYQMQSEATDAFDLEQEPARVRGMYGETVQGRQMLIARRLVERGVRFVQVWHGGWDHHTNLELNIRRRASECDQAIGALIHDLKQRGLLNETLVLWGGEFGRTPRHDRGARGEPGRDHHNRAFSVWMAGGGVRGGQVYGGTDEFGYDVVQNRVHIHDLHATILAVLGFDHEKLTYRYNGRDFRLTDVYGHVIRELIS